MIYDLVVFGRIADAVDGVHDRVIGIENGIITKITDKELEGKKTIKTSDSCIIFHGFIDAHVHLREDASGKWNYKEDFITGSMAALHGGVTVVADMPNTPEPAINKDRIIEKKKIAEKALIDILFYGGVSADSEIEEIANLVPAYKIYTEETTGELTLDWMRIENAVKRIALMNKPVVFHCGDEEINKKAAARLKGLSYPSIHCDMKPRESETAGIERVLGLCSKYNARAHITHVSAKESLGLIDKYRKEMPVTCDATPHHLFFTRDDMEDDFLKMNPPLRTRNDCKALIEALKNGGINFLASDHAPHTLEEKSAGAAGVPQLDTYGNFVLWLFAKGFSEKRIAEISSYNAARFLGLNNQGRVAEGFAANLAILDTGSETEIRNENMQTKCKWTPFSGMKFPGRVLYTICKGRIAMDNGKIA